MRMNKTIVSDKYRDYQLPKIDSKTKEVMTFYTTYLDQLLKLIETAQQTMQTPHAMHLRIKLEEGIQLKQVIDRVVKHFRYVGKTKNLRYADNKPMYLVKREVDSSQDGEHYHLAFVVDGWKTKNPYFKLNEIMTTLHKNGIVKHYSIPQAQVSDVYPFNEKLNSLPLLEYKAKAVYWLSYLCKVRSTIDGQKCLWLVGTNNRRVIKRQTLAPIPVISACDSVSAPAWF